MTAWIQIGLNNNDRLQISNILDSIGEQLEFDDEKFINIATAISGSGPAYLFLLMESMIDSGV